MMAFTERVRDTLDNVGQVAAEVDCSIEGYREFISIYVTSRDRIMNCAGKFTYLDGAATIFRAIRFRVNSKLIDDDLNADPGDLIGLQEIFLPSEQDVEFVLSLWEIDMRQLLPPKDVEIPV